MEGEDRGDYGILTSEIFQLKSLGTITSFFRISLGFGKFIIRMWDNGNGIGNE